MKMNYLRSSRAKGMTAIAVLTVLVMVAGLGCMQKTKPIKTRINKKDGAEMVWIPAGEFIMGSNDGDDDVKPAHQVYLDGYWIYKYPVTVAQYRKFCWETGGQTPWSTQGSNRKKNHPVELVNWQQAADYCEWAGGRLPTEAEWEKAARGTDGRKYPWGNEWDNTKCANSVKTSMRSSVSIGSFSQGTSPYGVYDMVGNVSQWCADWYGEHYYKNAPRRNPRGPDSGQWRIMRGGSRDNIPERDFRCFNRDRVGLNVGLGDIGFRCVQSQ